MTAAPDMQWTDGHVWVTDLELPKNEAFEYKVVHVSASSVHWEQSQNRQVIPLQTPRSSFFPSTRDRQHGDHGQCTPVTSCTCFAHHYQRHHVIPAALRGASLCTCYQPHHVIPASLRGASLIMWCEPLSVLPALVWYRPHYVVRVPVRDTSLIS